ncbi:hypothetical protein EW026_g4808 [Hermanssonia centrifuga]|uniref:ferric-chelate reductase (NADPH) n=1 Tax=Hermanssonia centrifuga TaxID=98765 RepID=A0A4S4KGA7_9APHY|nr:hypothetical protein EW026_g4808 [Hermanssonia centrifuga]
MSSVHRHASASASVSGAVSASAVAVSATATAAAKTGGRVLPYPPKHIWYFLSCTIAVATFINLASVAWAFHRRRVLRRGGERPPFRPRNGKVSLRRLPNAVLTASRIFSFRWRIPHVNMYVIEALLTAIYLLATLLWEFVNSNNLSIKTYANRAGYIAASQFPLIVCLATKNNALQVLTGISHEKLNLMHRAVSRAMLLMVWIHWWSRTYINSNSLTTTTWRSMGTVAGVIHTVMTLISIAPIRKRFYEFFFITHITLVFTFLVAAYLHVSGPNFGFYIWPCFLIWGLDRLCRWARYAILSNFQAPNKSPANLELVNDDTIRVTVRRWVPFGWRAGQHFFLAFPTLGPIESHPFTIANIPEGEQKVKEIVWIIRARGGFTKRLKEHILEKKGACKAPVFLDGPYGAPPDITPFDTCIFFAGGSGVTYTMARLRELLNDATAGRACVRRIVWVWAVRHPSHINWISSELVKALTSAPAGIELSCTVYVTSSPPSTPVSESAAQTLAYGESGIPKSSQDPEKDVEYDEKQSTVASHSNEGYTHIKGVELLPGRPDVRKILEESITTSDGPVSVDVSGPTPLVSSIRLALSSDFASPMAVLRGAPTVQLNVEDFTM